MATTSNIYTLLKFYASRQKSPMIDFGEFAEYLKRYAQHHVEENQDLVVYVGNPTDPLQQELAKLVESHQIAIVAPSQNKQFIFVASFFIEKYAAIYREIETNSSIPFPNINDLPKNTPSDLVNKQQAVDVIYHLLDTKEINDNTLYGISFVKDIPAVLFPSSIPITQLINTALEKIREMLRKDEFHDYFQKKLSISNPGKEMTAKNFFNSFVQKPDSALETLKSTGDTFYYWSQLCYFIKQDYDKLKDFTIEDINILQSVCITEVATSYFKSKVSEKNQKESAFKVLDSYLEHPPYFFTFTDITKMKDPHGIPLLGQYNDADLKQHMQALTSQTNGTDLPKLLVFRVDENEGYFIMKDKVMPLVVRLCSDARITIRDYLTKEWSKVIQDFDTVPEMKEQRAFELCLKRETEAAQPILYALLNTNFLPLISYESHEDEESEPDGKLTLFRDGNLIPYSEILMMSRQEILTDVKIKLPFWYTMPVISWIASLLLHKPKTRKKDRKNTKTAVEKALDEQKVEEAEKERKKRMDEVGDPQQSRKQELRQAAATVESQIVPANSTLDRELTSYCHEWNNLIGKQTHDNLTEDVNSLIRDYMRKVLRTLKSSGFTADRIKSLAESLVASPGMQKIKNHDALEMYTQLYMVKLVKNIP